MEKPRPKILIIRKLKTLRLPRIGRIVPRTIALSRAPKPASGGK
jgi:hypothetical protein